MISFQKATKKQAKARIGLVGPAGSGKTYSALAIAATLGARVAVVDTERGSASKYSDKFSFEVLELTTHSPERYVEAIQAAEQAGFDVLIIDSLSHAWIGKDGALDQVDKRASSGRDNNFTAWRHVTPMHNALVDAMLGAKLHIIATLRSKTEWVLEKEMKNGREITVPRKIGMAPVQREGLDYEFDIVGDLDTEHNLTISKTRCSELANQIIRKPGKEFAETVRSWLTDGAAVIVPATATPGPASQPQANSAPKQTDEKLAEGVKPIAAPAPPDKALEEQLAERMRAAKSQAELDGVAGEIAGLVRAGKIAADARGRLLAVYETVAKKGWSAAA
jgi:hypothetical protein